MKELVLFVAQSLVENKDAVTVQETVGPEATILELHVAPEDMGKVIGKQGRIAKAIRAVVRAATAKDQKPGQNDTTGQQQQQPQTGAKRRIQIVTLT